MTILQLYIQNGACAGFWVQHRRWRNACALVQRVELHSGHPTGQDPRADRIVLRCFDVRSGRPIDEDSLDQPSDREFERIAEPFWCHGRSPTFQPSRT
jgi:hypothetical protein